MNDDDIVNDLCPEERASLHSLERERRLALQSEDRIVRALRREGLIEPGRKPLWVTFAKLAGMAAALILAFVLGAEYESHNRDETPPLVNPIVLPEGKVTDELMVTQLHMDGEDPLFHYSDASDNPQGSGVLVKTWDY